MKKRDKFGRFCSLKIDKKYLYDLYIVKRISLPKIAKLLKISNHTIYDKIHELGWFKKRQKKEYPECLVCGKRLGDYRSKRCNSHAQSLIKKELFRNEPERKKLMSEVAKKAWKHLEFREKMNLRKYAIPWNKKKNIKNIDTIHHIDGNHNNNIKQNLMKIKYSDHCLLHSIAYSFLVKINLVNDYLDYFFNKNTNIKDRIGSKVIHHIDSNKNNNDENNLMYLKDKKIHTKLHRCAYNYLVRKNRIKDYLSWFFLKKRKNNQILKVIEEL